MSAADDENNDQDQNEINIENMSDEEFMNMSSPPKTHVKTEEEEESDSSLGSQDESQSEEEQEDNNSNASENDSEGNDSTNKDRGSEQSSIEEKPKEDIKAEKTNPLGDADEEEEDKKEKPSAKQKPDTENEKAEKAEKPKTESDKDGEKESVKAEEKNEPLNYESLYKEIMKPFKANGKEIKVHNPAEAIQLMQMGANYTKKLQSLQPSLKIVRMLENQGLLDESKLSFLIDLNRKNPEAIKKLVKDAGIDPMDMDTSVEPAYKAGQYTVSDQQMTFDNVLQDVGMTEVGQKTVVMIDKEWDKASKEAIWKDPEILRVITNQKEAGLYDQIADEVNRQRTLGYLTNVPFIDAYKEVGDIMQRNGFLQAPNQAQAPATQQATGHQQAPVQQQAPKKQVLDTRPAQQKTVSDNGDKARAAAPVKTAPKATPSQDFNPLAMSDEEFEKSATLAKRL